MLAQLPALSDKVLKWGLAGPILILSSSRPAVGAVAAAVAVTPSMTLPSWPRKIKPGRFISWSNNGQQHCVATRSAQPPRRFLGPVVLSAGQDSLIPVVDILVGVAMILGANRSLSLRLVV